jgi:hypothetical protein
VHFYVPSTSTLKNTYQDQAQTILNANPVILNARGEATIWGSGSYRQVLQDADGNLIWDKYILDYSKQIDDLQEQVDDFIAALQAPSGASMVGTSTGRTVEQRFVASDANLSTVASRLARVDISDSEVDPSKVVADAPTTNGANPNIADSNFATPSDQLWRVYNPGGVPSAQNPATLGTFAMARKYDVIDGTAMVLSMHNAPLNFQFYFNPVRLDFFLANGNFHSSITTGFTVNGGGTPVGGMVNVRSIEFTVPAGAKKIGVTIRNPFDFNNTDPMPLASMQACLSNVMLNPGTIPLPYEPWSSGAYNPTTDLFDPTAVGTINVALQDHYAYIRTACQQSADSDVVWRVRFNYAPSYFRVDSRSGVVDFYGIRFIDKTSPLESTISAFNQSTRIQSMGIDESCPEKFNSMFLGGGHGVIGYEVTKAAHGMTNVDVGSIWSDGTANWVLMMIVNVNTLMFIRRYTGTISKWLISSNAPSSATFTHVSGATHTGNIVFTAPVQKQFVPALRSYLLEMTLDGMAISDDGLYAGNKLILSELYSIQSPASQQDYLVGAVGTSSPDYTNVTIAEQIRVFYEYSWNQWGALAVRAGRGIKQAYSRVLAGAPGDYWGAIQLQRVTLVGDSTPGPNYSVSLYIPEVAPVSGYDFKNIADITANAAIIQIPKASCTDPNNPASHFCQFGKDSGGNLLSGHLYGLNRNDGLGIPANRSASVTYVMYFSSADKQYIVGIDATAGDSVAGSILTATGFRVPFLPTDADLTIPGVLVTVGEKHYCYITAHKVLTKKIVRIPAELNGLPVSTIKAGAGVTIATPYVSDAAIEISTMTNYGDVVLEIG